MHNYDKQFKILKYTTIYVALRKEQDVSGEFTIHNKVDNGEWMIDSIKAETLEDAHKNVLTRMHDNLMANENNGDLLFNIDYDGNKKVIIYKAH